MEDYAISINLLKLPIPLRNKYMKIIKKLNIRYLHTAGVFGSLAVFYSEGFVK